MNRPERDRALQELRIAQGQLEAVTRMLEEGRYCVEVSTQLLAVMSLIRKANLSVLEGHMKSCVRQAMLSSEEDGDQKISEMMDILSRYCK